jgi:hypothetical protein
MFEKFPMSRPSRAASKESILRQADTLRAEARRARRLSADVIDETDRQSLARHITDLEATAARLEKAAVEAKSG